MRSSMIRATSKCRIDLRADWEQTGSRKSQPLRKSDENMPQGNAGAMMLNLRCDHLFLQASQNCVALAYRQSHGGRRELLYTLNHGNFVLGGLARNHLRNQLQCPFHPNSLRHSTTLHALTGNARKIGLNLAF